MFRSKLAPKNFRHSRWIQLEFPDSYRKVAENQFAQSEDWKESDLWEEIEQSCDDILFCEEDHIKPPPFLYRFPPESYLKNIAQTEYFQTWLTGTFADVFQEEAQHKNRPLSDLEKWQLIRELEKEMLRDYIKIVLDEED